ncbi:hypothetical protein BCR35DRAFT_109709 [Leucosporidium creatinivorum]|uniref:HIG1 domain-containing protein n=1 Tax=Leucosporidium creatinivorum TaxID=106004 RepID=A0A1Y2G1Z7_9BASI|nr:hypothetical protein BCR35DRAFT_109709 [Leucosporidium creatinivorum]
MVKATRDISDEKAAQNATVKGGLQSAAYGLGAGLVGSLAAQRAGVKAYRSLTLPLKAFALTSVTTAAFIIGADSASRNYELKKYQIGSGTALERESREGITAEQQAGIGGQARQKVDLSKLSTKDMLVEWGKEHRYGTVFAAWAASMVGSFGYISMTPLSFAQKLVQARMVRTRTKSSARRGSRACTSGRSDRHMTSSSTRLASRHELVQLRSGRGFEEPRRRPSWRRKLSHDTHPR